MIGVSTTLLRSDSQVNTSLHRLRRAGVEVTVSSTDGLPEIIHWGADLGPVDESDLRLSLARQISPSALDHPWPLSILPGESDGWAGRPGVSAHRDGIAVLPRWVSTTERTDDGRLLVHGVADGIAITVLLHLDEFGVLRMSQRIVNTGVGSLHIHSLEMTAPVGDAAAEVLDFSGRWTRERTPQRAPLLEGSRIRESRRGRTGHDSPLLLAVGTTGYSDSAGELWAVHLGWSGDSVHRIDALPESRAVIGAGPLLRAGEIVLEPDASFTTPSAVFVWTDTGLDGIARRLHRSVRDRPSHPTTPRPVTLNTWEAVYFDHDLDRLTALADTAASVGVERFVLDDGWFKARRSDDAGLGDWTVDPLVWPHGLHPLRQIVRDHGMQFGLWVEPEMVNLDSDLARAHPDWILSPRPSGTRSWREQFVLDVERPEVTAYLLEAISALVTEYDLDYLKWDQNRDLIEAVRGGRAVLHRHTEAVYALFDALRSRHPDLEIESCSSGGARVDLGILERTDRVWPSDSNDAVARLDIQRWTELLLPPELIGAHVGPPVAHTTRRASTLAFRIACALFGSFGIEWDITGCTPAELAELEGAISAYRRLRPLIHSGDVDHLDLGDDGLRVTAITSRDQSSAVIRVARVELSGRSLPKLLRVPGLTPSDTYRLQPAEGLALDRFLDVSPPPWFARGHLDLTGAALSGLGVRLPQLGPGQAIIFELNRIGTPS